MKAYELLSDESKWTQKVFARSASGFEVNPQSEKAVCWCALGALRKCYGEFTTGYGLAIGKLALALGLTPILIAGKNDNPATTFEEIRNALKEADL